MLSEALRYPLATRSGRDALAICVGLALVVRILLRGAGTLWPTWLAFVPALLALVPAALFAGYLGRVLRYRAPDPPAFALSRETLRTGLRLLTVAGAYLLVPAAVLLGVVVLILETGATPRENPFVALAPTVALFSLLVFGYVLPGGLGTGVERGVRPALSRRAVGGLGSAGYFFGWTAALALVAVAWGVLGAAQASTPLSILATAAFTYAHVVAVRLVADGLERSGWVP